MDAYLLRGRIQSRARPCHDRKGLKDERNRSGSTLMTQDREAANKCRVRQRFATAPR
jgi:hypothetical protein